MADVADADLLLSERQEISRRVRVVLPAILLVMFLASLDMQIVNTALPRIVSDLGGLSHLSWVATGFIVAAAAATPLYGKLGDMYGRKPVLIASLSIFLVASALAGLSRTMIELVLFRALQGAGAGGLMVLSQTVIADIIPPRERGRYQGLFTGVQTIASVSGPLVGGLLTSLLNWRWVFYINLPLGLAAMAMLWFGLKIRHERHAHHIDYPGAALLTAATVCGLLGLSWAGSAYGWGSPVIIGLFAATAVFVGVFFWAEPRAKEPIMALHLFRNRVFSISVTATVLMRMALASALVFLPLYYQLVLGRTPAQSGLMILPQIFGMLVSSIVGGYLATAFGRVKPLMICGLGLQAGSLIVIAFGTVVGAPGPLFMAAIGTFGLGMGLGMPMARLAVQNTVSRAELGVATSGLTYIGSLGSSLGVTIGGALMTVQLQRLLTERAPGVDHKALIERGVAALIGLPPHVRDAAAEAYRLSISSSYVMSAVAMSLALLLAIWMPSEVLRSTQD